MGAVVGTGDGLEWPGRPALSVPGQCRIFVTAVALVRAPERLYRKGSAAQTDEGVMSDVGTGQETVSCRPAEL